jgi:hypothetical protein
LLKPSLVAITPTIAAITTFTVFTHTAIITTSVCPSARNPAATACAKLPNFSLITDAASSTRFPSHSSNQANAPVHAPQILAVHLITIANAALANANFTNANLTTATIDTFASAMHTDASD